MSPFLWHIAGTPFAPHRCRHRVLVEAGPYFLVAARCGRNLPDPSEPWPVDSEPKVRQIARSVVDAPLGGHRSRDWYSAPPPLPPKAERPLRPELPVDDFPWTFEVLRSVEPSAADLAALDLTSPFTEEELRTAYRRKARVAHPDCGGSPESFIALRAAYDRLASGVALRRAS